MIETNGIEKTLASFQKAAAEQAIAIEEGNHKTANKKYTAIVKAVAILKEQNAVNRLADFLKDPSVGVRLAAATYLLPVEEKKATKELINIARSSGIHALTAGTTITEWKKGNLKL